MKPDKILVATDFSPAADVAVQRAAVLARQLKAQLRVIHVLPPKRLLEGILGSRHPWAREVRSVAGDALKSRANHVEVIGAHTRRRREPVSTYGNVCRYLASLAPADVLIVP